MSRYSLRSKRNTIENSEAMSEKATGESSHNLPTSLASGNPELDVSIVRSSESHHNPTSKSPSEENDTPVNIIVEKINKNNIVPPTEYSPKLMHENYKDSDANQSENNSEFEYQGATNRLEWNDKPEHTPDLTSEDEETEYKDMDTIELAANSLTLEQKDLIRRRDEILRANDSEAGTSTGKGKNIDPRNWGAALLPPEDLDIEAQQEEINRYNKLLKDTKDPKQTYRHKNKKGKKGKNKDRKRTHKHRSVSVPISNELLDSIQKTIKSQKENRSDPKSDLFASSRKTEKEGMEKNMKPIHQIDQRSYLGNAFKNVKESELRKAKTVKFSKESSYDTKNSGEGSQDDESGGTSSPSSQSDYNASDNSDAEGGSSPSIGSSSPNPSDSGTSSSSSPSDSESNSTLSRSPTPRKRRGKKKHHKSQKSLLKPIPPEKYDGKADPQAFHRFMTQATDYVVDGQAPRHRQVSIISNFLSDKAYTFYTREIAFKPEKWNLERFFTELFNYCFPPNFRTLQRQCLNRCRQGNRPVKEFASELHELFMTVGYIDKRSRVDKLWHGLRLDIQQSLWKDRLNPDTSSYESVLRSAEVNEIANSLASSSRHGFESPNFGNHKYERKKGHRERRHSHRGTRSEFRHERKDKREQRGYHRNNGRVSPFGKRTNRTPHFNSNEYRRNNRSPRRRHGRPNPEYRKKTSSSNEDLDKLRAENRCFYCKEVGHMSRQCPKRNHIPSSSRNKPPGIPNNNIELSVIQEAENLRELVDSTEGLNSLNIGMMTYLEGDTTDHLNEEHAVELEIGDHLEYFTCCDGDINIKFPIEEDNEQYHFERRLTPKSTRERVRDWIEQVEAAGHLINLLPNGMTSSLPSHNKATRAFHRDKYLVTKEGRICTKLGDPFQAKLLATLEYFAPFCSGEWENTTSMQNRARFYVTNNAEDYYTLRDDVLRFYFKIKKIYVERFSHLSIARLYMREMNKLLGKRMNKWHYDLMTWQASRIMWNDARIDNLLWVLNTCYDLVFERANTLPMLKIGTPRFSVQEVSELTFELYDSEREFRINLSTDLLQNEKFDAVNWHHRNLEKWDEWPQREYWDAEIAYLDISQLFEPQIQCSSGCDDFEYLDGEIPELLCFGQQVEVGTYPAIERNSSTRRNVSRSVPRPLVIVVNINGHPARALLDSGSLGDFMSTNLAQQLSVKRIELTNPVNIQMAVQGSRTKVNYGTKVLLEYQKIKEERYFDIINLSNYDLILGTPFLFQHRVSIGIEPPTVLIGSDKSVPITGDRVSKLASRPMTILEDKLEEVREYMRNYAKKVCLDGISAPLPPLRDINHEIPLIDEHKRYSWRPSRCPDALRGLWNNKRDAYLKSGRWEMRPVGNAVPMLLIPKPGKPGEPLKLRTVIDLRERNQNTRKLSSPLPDMDSILRAVAQAKFRSVIDLTDAYEQIRIKPEHVERTAMNTPDGTMVSLVMQQGDCNASATFQLIMTRIFAPYVGKTLKNFLDDLFLMTSGLQEHVEIFVTVIDILEQEKFFISPKKLHLLEPVITVLGRKISNDGISMDPDKVDALVRWKTPTNRDLLRGFLGSAGFLADDIARIRIPMGILHQLTGDTVPFRWDHTHQRAFEDIKRLASDCKSHHRKPLDYSANAPPGNIVTDGCLTGIAGVVSQGEDWRTAKVAAFFSAKLNAAQQNYPVHEIELLAGIETMLRHRDILFGVDFRWFTDHKGLEHFLNQKGLSGRQARWLEKVAEFRFKIFYVKGSENVLSDALSRIYSNESPGTVRARSEYTYHDVIDNDKMPTHLITMPVLVGLEGGAEFLISSLNWEPIPRVDIPLYSVQCAERKEGELPTVHTMNATKTNQTKQGNKKKLTITLPARKQQPSGTRLTIKLPAKRVNNEAKETEDLSATQQSHVPNEVIPSPDDRRTLTHHTVAPPERPPSPATGPPAFNDIFDGGREGLNLISIIKNRYSEDNLFKDVVNKPKDYKNFVVKDGLVYLKERDAELLCIPDVLHNGQSIREIIISEAHSLLAHLSSRKSLLYLRDHVWWKSMARDVNHFCETCVTCMRSKSPNHRPYGLLNPLKVPNFPWESVGIDFVGPLPESKDRDASYDSITVVIDRLTGMIHLVPSRQNYNAKHVAELVFSEIYRLHGLPKTIISDRDTLFTSTFWRRLHELIGTKLNMSSAYHPESDGATERANRTITQMIRQCISPNQRDWALRLPAIEFALNIARSEVTGFAPFFLNYGRIPRSLIWNSPDKSEYPGVRTFALRLKNAIISAHDSILAHRVKETRTANRRRIPSPFKIGDLVYISTKNISFPKQLAKKFVPKFVGPYPILQDFGNNSYKIGLSVNLKRRGVHDVFHSSLLRVHMPNDDRLFPGRADNQIWDFEDSEQEWAVDKVISHSGSRENALFQILWKTGDKTWLPFHQVEHLSAMEQYFNLLGIENISQLSENSVAVDVSDTQVLLGNISISEGEIVPGGSRIKGETSWDEFVGPLGLLQDLRKSSPAPDLLSNSMANDISLHVNVANHVVLPRDLHIGIDLPYIGIPDPVYWTLKEFTDGDQPLFRKFTPSMLRLYLTYEYRLRTGNPDSRGAPIGFNEFIGLWNKQPIEYKLTEWDPTEKVWFLPPDCPKLTKDHIDLSIYSHAVPPVIFPSLVSLGLMNDRGVVNEDGICYSLE